MRPSVCWLRPNWYPGAPILWRLHYIFGRFTSPWPYKISATPVYLVHIRNKLPGGVTMELANTEFGTFLLSQSMRGVREGAVGRSCFNLAHACCSRGNLDTTSRWKCRFHLLRSLDWVTERRTCLQFGRLPAYGVPKVAVLISFWWYRMFHCKHGHLRFSWMIIFLQQMLSKGTIC